MAAAAKVRETAAGVFRRECDAAGIAVTDVRVDGRRGPGVVCGKLADAVEAVRATTGRVQWRAEGSGWVVWPAG